MVTPQVHRASSYFWEAQRSIEYSFGFLMLMLLMIMASSYIVR